MANPSLMRIADVHSPRAAKVEVPLGNSVENAPKVPEAKVGEAKVAEAKLAEVSSVSPRKLVRPGHSANAYATRGILRHAPVLSQALHASGIEPLALPPGTSHAEAFYLQKQVQAKTRMVFVLDDGEHIEGYIEWYDSNVVKVRHGGSRTLIYKCCIKYLYKAGDNGPL